MFKRLWKQMKRLFIVWVRDRIVVRKTLKDFYMVIGGHIFFELLLAAIELDFFTLLKKKKKLTMDEVAKSLGLQEAPARMLLLGLVSTGLIKKRGAYYKNTYLADRALCTDSPLYVGNNVRWMHYICYKPMFHTLESLKQNTNVGLVEIPGPGTTLYERMTAHPELETIFQNAMEEISVQANTELAEYLDFHDGETLVDVGGGKGVNIVALAREHKTLRASVFDFPSVCAKAEKNFVQEGMQDRLSAIPGNCFKDPFPTGKDSFLFCHFICIWSKEENIALLKKAYDALKPGGRVILYDAMQDDDECGPLASAMGSPYFLALATGRGMHYTIREYEDFCRQAGFTKVKRLVLPAEQTVVISYKT